MSGVFLIGLVLKEAGIICGCWELKLEFFEGFEDLSLAFPPLLGVVLTLTGGDQMTDQASRGD